MHVNKPQIVINPQMNANERKFAVLLPYMEC
jgi:hypothetical protein